MGWGCQMKEFKEKARKFTVLKSKLSFNLQVARGDQQIFPKFATSDVFC